MKRIIIVILLGVYLIFTSCGSEDKLTISSAQYQGLLAEIETLKAENDELKRANYSLKEENRLLDQKNWEAQREISLLEQKEKELIAIGYIGYNEQYRFIEKIKQFTGIRRKMLH